MIYLLIIFLVLIYSVRYILLLTYHGYIQVSSINHYDIHILPGIALQLACNNIRKYYLAT